MWVENWFKGEEFGEYRIKWQSRDGSVQAGSRRATPDEVASIKKQEQGLRPCASCQGTGCADGERCTISDRLCQQCEGSGWS